MAQASIGSVAATATTPDYRRIELLFEDPFELSHVFSTLDDRRELAKVAPSPARTAAFQNGPMQELAKRLKKALVFTGIDESDVLDYNEVWQLLCPPNNLHSLQEACAQALVVVYSISSPEDLDRRFDELKESLQSAQSELIYARQSSLVDADAHRRRVLKRNAQKPRGDALTKYIENLLKRRPNLDEDGVRGALTRAAENGDETIQDVTKRLIKYVDRGRTMTCNLTALKDRISRARRQHKKK